MELCLEFIRDYGGQIMEQLQTLGASLDYRRHRFDGRRLLARGDAVLRAPLGQGLQYRDADLQLVPLCPMSTVADLEVRRQDGTTR